MKRAAIHFIASAGGRHEVSVTPDTTMIEKLGIICENLLPIRTQMNADRQDKEFEYKELTAKITEFSIW